MSTQNNTKFDTLKIKKKKVLSTERQNGGDDTFLGTADKSAERHVVAMPMQDGVKTRSLKSTWLTAGPDTSKTKLLMPTLVKVVKDFPGKCSPEQLQSYIAKVFGDSTTASPAEITWKLKCTVKQVKIPPNGRSHAYCLGSVLPDGSAEIESMQKLRKDLKDHDIHVAVLHKTDVVEVSVPVRDIVIDVLVADPQKMVLILEVWSVKKEEEKKGNMRRMTSVTSSLNEPGDKFAGRAFCPLQGVQLEGEGRELPLYSHSKRHKRGELWVHLGYKPSQVADVSTAMMNYGHLFKLLAFHESSEQPGHVLMWSAKLSLQAMHLLRAQAILSGISDLQCIAMELGALLDYHEHYEVQWSIFLSLVERIETNLSEQPVPSQGSKQEWPPELHEQLKELSKCIQDRLYAHLCILGTAGEDDQKGVRKAAPGQQKEHPIAAVKGEQITLLQTLQKMYSFQPFVEQSGGTMEDCIKSPIEEWFRSSSSSASMQLPKGQSSKAPVLKAMAEACHDVCQLVQKYIVAVFKEFGVDYYSIFIQMIGSKLSELCTDCISKEKSLPPDRDTAIVYYLAYLVCRLIEKCASTVDPSLLDKLNIWRCYEPLVGSWIEAACIICKDRIQKAVESDTVVRVTDGACHSSSAVDVELFLHQALTFWKSLNWPDAEQAFGYALAHFQNICHCVEDYAKTIFKWVNTKDLSEKSFEMDKVEKVCIVFNNMAHLRNQLNTVSEKLDLESLYTRLTHGQNDAKKSFDRLRESTREDIEHKIVSFVEDYCKRLAPDIQSYITNIMATGHETDASLEALHDYLTQSLQAFGDYLLDEVFQIILARVWSTTLKCFQAALPDVEKGSKGQEQSNTLHLALLALLNFFFADGNGLSKENLENARYKSLLTDLEHKCLATSDLVFKCCTQLSLRQPQTSAIGELFISARYVEEIPALVVHVSHAKLFSGVKKDGTADTFVQVWMIPQMVLQDTKSHYKTDIKKGTLTPTYDKDFQLPATTEDFKRAGAVLALAVYYTDTKHIAGLGLVPCQDIPIVRAQGSYVRTYTNKEWTLPLFLIQDTSSVPLRELLMRKSAHDSEATNFYKYLDKKLHVSFRTSPSMSA